MIYQSGYLTIVGYNPTYGLYQLGIPNQEVADGFYNYLLPNYANVSESQTAFFIANFVEEIKAGQTDAFLKRLSVLFADFTYVMEFKLDGTAEEALRQIEEKHYAQPFEGDAHRELVKVGVNFSSATRNIERWVVGE
jgi:hypothetical protein